MLSILRRKRRSEESEPDLWPVRDKFAQNLFDALDEETQPIFLIYLVSEGKGDQAVFRKVPESAHQYRGGRIMMPAPRRRWGIISHVGLVVDGKLQSNWRVTPELPIATWDIHADRFLANMKGRIAKSTIAAAVGKIKNPFR